MRDSLRVRGEVKLPHVSPSSQNGCDFGLSVADAAVRAQSIRTRRHLVQP
jgi:hypothetical protein